MNRHVAAKQLSMYLDEEVQREEARRIERHLEECADCRERLEGLRRVVSGLQDLQPMAPPSTLGLELQRQLARSTPPFGDPAQLGRGGVRRVMQPVVLASLGVVLALAIIVLLFLQAVQRQGAGGEARPPAAVERADVLVGERSFRRTASGWVETSVDPTEAASARELTLDEIDGHASAEVIEHLLDELSGTVTLRLGGEVVRFSSD